MQKQKIIFIISAIIILVVLIVGGVFAYQYFVQEPSYKGFVQTYAQSYTEFMSSIDMTQKIVQTDNGKQVVINDNTNIKCDDGKNCTLNNFCAELKANDAKSNVCSGWWLEHLARVVYIQKGNLFYATSLYYIPQ